MAAISRLALLITLPALIFSFPGDEAAFICLVEPHPSDVVYHAFISDLIPLVVEAEESLARLTGSEYLSTPDVSTFRFEQPENFNGDAFDVVIESTSGRKYLSEDTEGYFKLVNHARSGQQATAIFYATCQGVITIGRKGLPLGLDNDGRITTNVENDTQVFRLLPSADVETLRTSGKELAAGKAPRCPKSFSPVEKKDARPKGSNGCGAKGGVPVPDLDFTPCCDGHDFCYDDCGSTWEDCNSIFGDCMAEICAKKNYIFLAEDACRTVARMYEQAVGGIIGKKAFLDAGKDRCDCVRDDITNANSGFM